MRTYYVFIIKDSLLDFYKDRSYSLYKILEEIYNLKSNDIILGYRLLEQVAEPFNTKNINEFMYEEHKSELSYYKDGNNHIIKNLYSKEITLLKIFNSHIKIKSNQVYSSFFSSINTYNKNVFVCDFYNRDYFWVSNIGDIKEINLETIV